MLDPRIYKSYREYLRGVLETKKKLNPAYSLRAFARDIHLSPPQLSEVISGKKGLSMAAAERAARSLRLDEMQIRYFCDLVQAADARSPTAKRLAVVRVREQGLHKDFQPLSQDAFHSIAEWHHYAIMELVATRNFSSLPKDVARSIGISVVEARKAVERLIRLGLLAKDAITGELMRTGAQPTTTKNIRNDAVRVFNTQILQKAAASLENTPIDERDLSTITMAIDESKYAEACERIKNFRRELCAFLEDGPQTRVYCMAIQLFPLSEKKEPKL